MLLLVEVGAVGNHGAHADGQREEHLPTSGGNDLEDAGGFLNDAVGNRPAGDEHVLQTVDRAGERTGADDADQQHEKQRRHADAAELLDAARDAAHDDDHREDDEDQAVDHALALTGEECAEHLTAAQAVRAEGRAGQVADVEDDVLQAVAAEGAVKAHDEERGSDTQPADPLEALGQRPVGGDGTLAGFAADGQLAHHDDKAAQNREDQVDDEEREAAVGTHFVGEAPDVAQADGRADCGHQESKIGSKAFSFFHSFLSF